MVETSHLDFMFYFAMVQTTFNVFPCNATNQPSILYSLFFCSGLNKAAEAMQGSEEEAEGEEVN